MKAKVTNDRRFLQIVECDNAELEQIKHSLNKRISNWRFHPLVKRGVWNGMISFIDKFNRVPVGLWNELNTICNTYGFSVEIDGFNDIIDETFDESDFREFINDFYQDHPKIHPYDYQIDAAIPILKYRRNISELATSAGKTLILFMIFSYLFTRKKSNKFLMVVPNTNLILQTLEDFEMYNNGKLKFNTQAIHGGTDKTKIDVDFIIGTYQSLVKRTKDFFDNVDVIAIDEAHSTNANSIKKIISNCTNAVYAFGVSGTMLQNGSTEALTIQAYLGPLVNNISASYLMDNNYATKLSIKVIILNYLDFETKQKLHELRKRRHEIDGTKLLDIEKKLVVENRTRFVYVCDFISKSTKNSLVLFQNIKDDYGRRIYDYLREKTADKIIYYVDGSTPIKLREQYIAEMEDGSNKILVASFGTFSQGISIKNLHNLFLVESYKSETIIRQSLGRGMRLLEGKEKVNVYDFVDNFTEGKMSKNYLLKHSEARIKIYSDQGFPVKKYLINF